MIVRRLVVAVIALLLAVQVVRNAAVSALATLSPAEAAKVWASHPAVQVSLGLAQIGTDARERKPIDPHTFAMLDAAAVAAPLASEPFLVRGVQAQTSGDAETARRAFVAAQARDPRSLSAAYFLADYYFRSGHALQGLGQASVLARLSPDGSSSLAPFVAAYAQNRSNWPQLRSLFRTQEWLEDSVLTALAQDPRNVQAILAVADANHRKPNSVWLGVLLRSLIANTDYQQARSLWSSIGGGNSNGAAVYDTDFSSPGPPPPFNWSLTTSTIGLAERQPGKRLHVIFYGNDDGVLASQLLLLPPGTYRLQMQVIGAPVHPETLRWSLRCDRASDPVASAGVDEAARSGWVFQVPANCPAQWLELAGRSGDVAQQSEITISGLSVARVAGNA